MPYVKSDGTYVYTESTGALFATQTAVTGAGNTSAQEVGQRATARLTLNVTAASGTTPSITVNIQSSPDNSTWTTLASFPAQIAVATAHQNFGPLDRYVRAQWGAPSGTTPSFTFNITGDLV